MGLRVLYPKFGVGHEVVNGCSRLGLLQPLIEGDGAAECIHHPDLEEARRDRERDRHLVTIRNDTCVFLHSDDTTDKNRRCIGSIIGEF